MKAYKLALVCALIAVLGASAASAQQGPPPGTAGSQFDDDEEMESMPGGPGQGAPLPGTRREEVRKKVQAVRIWRLTEELKLDSATSARLAALLSAIEQQRMALVQENRAAIMELQAVLRTGSPDDRTLRSILDRMEKNHREVMGLQEKERKDLKKILTIEQQARYVVFHRQFMREIRGMMMGAQGRGQGQGMRGSGPQRGNMGQGPGPGPGRPEW